MNVEDQVKQTLQRAREVYGNKNQILVCIEELNELAVVLAKYPRYEDEVTAVGDLYNKVLDEFADVVIIMDHIQNIFNISDSDIANRIVHKTERLERWLDSSNSMQETIDHRIVYDDSCEGCTHKGFDGDEDLCRTCIAAGAYDGNHRPYYNSMV